MTSEVLTVTQAARELNLSESTVYTAIRLGRLTATLTPNPQTPGRPRWLLARSELDRFRTLPRQRGSRRRLGDAELRTAIAGVRDGLTDEQAAERAGMTGRALRYRLAALGLRAGDLRPPAALAPLPDGPTRDDRRQLVHRLQNQRHWEACRAAGAKAWALQHACGRRDLHILLTPAAWEAIHAEAHRRQCSLSSLVAYALHEAGVIPEA